MPGGGKHIGLGERVAIDGAVAPPDTAVEAIRAAHVRELEEPPEPDRIADLGPHGLIRRGGEPDGRAGIRVGEKRRNGAGVESTGRIHALCDPGDPERRG
ncbi:MAG: hypothetical protein ACLFS5_07595 [Spirochaetaceae bacterium]